MKSNTPTDYKKFYKAVLSLKNHAECEAFFRDICTEGELTAMSQRIEVASLLRSGASYTEIHKKTGASTATISRISHYLQSGAEGYEAILLRIAPKRA